MTYLFTGNCSDQKWGPFSFKPQRVANNRKVEIPVEEGGKKYCRTGKKVTATWQCGPNENPWMRWMYILEPGSDKKNQPGLALVHYFVKKSAIQCKTPLSPVLLSQPADFSEGILPLFIA